MVTKTTQNTVSKGSAFLQGELATIPTRPGVYRMLDSKNNILYIGKAVDLRKRISNYAKRAQHPVRIIQMISKTAGLEITTTHTEAEALLLEANLIKRFRPRFNVILRDDKSYPHILLTGHHRWSRILKHRGARNVKGEYFGPFASATAVNDTINALQRIFPLRSCTDTVLSNRSRPCLQYQIKRCTAPCVGRINEADYQAIVEEAREFLTGRSRTLQKRLSQRMIKASDSRDYETATVYRDRIRALTQIQSQQGINVPKMDDADVVVAHQEAGQTCVQVVFFRKGCNYGNRAFFPSHNYDTPLDEVMEAFLGQFYTDKEPPKLVLTSHMVERPEILEQALAVRAQRRVRLLWPRKGHKRLLIEQALNNAREALGRRLAQKISQRHLLKELAQVFGLADPPNRIEVYDNSHIQGQDAVGCMIVSGPEGLVKSSYRRFSIKSVIAAGDDCGMIREVLSRRFKRLLNGGEISSEDWPDLLLIDGGKAQLNAAREVLADLEVTGISLIAIAKGKNRNTDQETFHTTDRNPLKLESNQPLLYFLQRLRDEAHRFAITTHRRKRSRNIVLSVLDAVPGVGTKRKMALLHHFGSATAVTRAGLGDLERVKGINKNVANTIYQYFHTND